VPVQHSKRRRVAPLVRPRKPRVLVFAPAAYVRLPAQPYLLSGVCG
jgi:hypothetical protein